MSRFRRFDLSGNLLRAMAGLTLGGSALVALANGNVGIDKANPATKLHMSSGTPTLDGTGAALQVGGSGTAVTQIRVYVVNIDPVNVGAVATATQVERPATPGVRTGESLP
jgi:hypothetical protein